MIKIMYLIEGVRCFPLQLNVKAQMPHLDLHIKPQKPHQPCISLNTPTAVLILG